MFEKNKKKHKIQINDGANAQSRLHTIHYIINNETLPLRSEKDRSDNITYSFRKVIPILRKLGEAKEGNLMTF